MTTKHTGLTPATSQANILSETRPCIPSIQNRTHPNYDKLLWSSARGKFSTLQGHLLLPQILCYHYADRKKTFVSFLVCCLLYPWNFHFGFFLLCAWLMPSCIFFTGNINCLFNPFKSIFKTHFTISVQHSMLAYRLSACFPRTVACKEHGESFLTIARFFCSANASSSRRDRDKANYAQWWRNVSRKIRNAKKEWRESTVPEWRNVKGAWYMKHELTE